MINAEMYISTVRKAAFFILVIALLSTACGKQENNTPIPEIELPKKTFPLVLKKEKEYHFDVITKGMGFWGKVEDKNNLYVYFLQNQDNNCEILKLSTDLELKNKYYIRRAAGPGEAQNPRIYGGDQSSIIVWDAPGFKFIKFDTNFKLLDEYRLTKNLGTFLYSGGHYVQDQNFVIEGFSSFINYHDAVVRLFKMQFPTDGNKKVREIKLLDVSYLRFRKDNEKYILVKPVSFGWFFGHIYILDKSTYHIIKMDSNGTILKEVKILYKSKSFSESLRHKWVYKYYANNEFMLKGVDFPEKLLPACWLVQLGDGIAVGRCEDYDPVIRDSIPADYFDRDLNYLGRIEFPYFENWNRPDMGAYHVDIRFYSKDGKLYFLDTRGEDEYWVVCYNIQ